MASLPQRNSGLVLVKKYLQKKINSIFIDIFYFFRDRSIVKWDYKSQDVLQEAEEKEELAKCKMDKSKRRRLSELQDLLFD